ncbi:hypothetical protein EVAR_20093_1 [Eumeta japonica]|uniref:Uncharacterized protein n=1 Tax=Eumeta variegata TaxID=151549 RepID=A0A4C1V3J2_EUMVA|nr:hypothetical protein EVAR_20093_1 [Eumeta japonica]
MQKVTVKTTFAEFSASEDYDNLQADYRTSRPLSCTFVIGKDISFGSYCNVRLISYLQYVLHFPADVQWLKGMKVPFDGTRSICHACWHRIDSDIRNQHRSPSPAILPAVGASVNVPQFTRVANTSGNSMMTRCNNLQLRRVPNSIKIYLLSYFGLYIPDRARICQLHLQNTSLEEFPEITAHQHTDFNADSFVDMVNMYTRALESRSRLDLENINEVSEDDLRYWTGLNHSQFEQLFQQVPSLHRQSVTPRTDLGVYLCKIRTGEPNTRLCTTFSLAETTLRRKLHLARECLLADFVPVHIGLDHITRTEVLVETGFYLIIYLEAMHRRNH